MFIFLKKRRRTPVLTTLLVILLAASFAVLCFTAAYRFYVGDHTKNLANAYTTIAVLDRTGVDEIIDLPNSRAFTLNTDSMDNAYDFMLNCNSAELDSRENLRAVVSGVVPVTTGSFDPMNYEAELDMPRNAAAFVVTCETIEYWNSDYAEPCYPLKSSRVHYKLSFRIDDTLLLHPDYTAPDVIYTVHWAFDENGSVPFQTGTQYVIFGLYEDIPIITDVDPETHLLVTQHAQNVDKRLIFQDNMKMEFQLVGDYYIESNYEYGIEAEINGVMDTIYCTIDENIATFCIPVVQGAAYTIESNEFLQAWLDTAKKNVSSAYCLTTTRLDSILHFNTGAAWVAEGRGFTDEEAASGAPVCIVHKNFAVYNNIQVGDRIDIDLFETSLSYTVGFLMDRNGLRDTDRHRGSLAVEVVGIYTAPEVVDFDIYQLSANTIIIPAAAVPAARLRASDIADEDERRLAEAKEIAEKYNPALFAAIIPSDRLDAFNEEAALAGVRDLFLVSDQNYSAVAERLAQINDSARLLFYLSLILLPVIMLILAALTLRERHEIGLLMSLGMNAKQTASQFFLGWAALVIAAMLISAAATAVSFDSLSRFMMDQTVQETKYDEGFETAPDNESREWTELFVDANYCSIRRIVEE